MIYLKILFSFKLICNFHISISFNCWKNAINIVLLVVKTIFQIFYSGSRKTLIKVTHFHWSCVLTRTKKNWLGAIEIAMTFFLRRSVCRISNKAVFQEASCVFNPLVQWVIGIEIHLVYLCVIRGGCTQFGKFASLVEAGTFSCRRFKLYWCH